MLLMRNRRVPIIGLFLLALLGPVELYLTPIASGLQQSKPIQPEERRRGSITPERNWWDLRHYALKFDVDIDNRYLRGSNTMRFVVLDPLQKMQIDLQSPMEISRVVHRDSDIGFDRDGDVYYLKFPEPLEIGAEESVTIEFQGQPREARNPPWDGGVAWKKDANGNPFVATACQGIGASVWWPCKDHGYDEPDDGVSISFTVPDTLVAVSNGRLQQVEADAESKTKTYHWLVTLPINSYCINMNIGDYVNFQDKYTGEFGELDLDFWVLRDEKERALTHFKEAHRTIEAFEYWFGKYPFYEDSFKLVSVPYLGMEHQSSVTYGNGFRNGYRGRDLSGTGVGLLFDFIIVHESGHEWFGNNISMADTADMWIHEGFTNYSENLFVEYHFSEKQAQDYVIGCRKLIQNDRPIIGQYNANRQGSGDMYYKGGNLLHTLRHAIGDDDLWRQILRGLNQEFWHQIVTTEQVEQFIGQKSERDWQKFFDQYLRTTKVPHFQFAVEQSTLHFRFSNVVTGFEMPIKLSVNNQSHRLQATDQWQHVKLDQAIEAVLVDRNFYVETHPVDVDSVSADSAGMTKAGDESVSVDAVNAAAGSAEPDSTLSISSDTDNIQAGKQIACRLELADDNTLEYLIYAPLDYQADHQTGRDAGFPLMLFLHGRGESHGDLQLVAKWGPPKLAAQGESLPFIIVSPQCPADDSWNSDTQQQRLELLLKHVIEKHNVDPSRIYLTGLSMGGYGSWSLAARLPDRFAAVVPICGGGRTSDADKLISTPIWAFHGDGDSVVPITNSVQMVRAIKTAGGRKVRLTILEHYGHNSWSPAYASPDLYQWLLSHQLSTEGRINN